MSDELNNYLLLIDTSKAHAELEEVEAHRDRAEEETQKVIKKVEQESRKAFYKAVTMMQRTWYATESILRTVGVTFPEVMRTVISGVFGALAAVKPLLLAESVTGIMTAQAIFGLSQVALSIAAAISAEREQAEAERTFNDVNSILGTVSSYIGGFSF